MNPFSCERRITATSRRDFLIQSGLGVGWFALADLLEREAAAATTPNTNPLAEKPPHFPAAAKRVIAAVAEGDMLRTQLAILRRLAKYEPFNTIELRQKIAQRAIEVGKYSLA